MGVEGGDDVSTTFQRPEFTHWVFFEEVVIRLSVSLTGVAHASLSLPLPPLARLH